MSAVGFEDCTVEQFAVSGAPLLAISGDVRPRQFPLRVTDSLALVLNIGPDQTILANGREVHVPANAAIFRPPNAVWTIPEQRFGFACINLHAELLPRDTRYDGFAWRPVPVLPSIAEVLDQLRVATARVRDHRVVALIETLFHAGLARSGERFAGEPNTARRAREFLEIAYTTNPSLDEIAAAAGINRFALVRLFRRAYGITPHAFQIRLKVRHAQRMLAAGHDLSYVAATVGFADLSHLTRHFRRVLGVTPGALARNLQFHSMR